MNELKELLKVYTEYLEGFLLNDEYEQVKLNFIDSMTTFIHKKLKEGNDIHYLMQQLNMIARIK